MQEYSREREEIRCNSLLKVPTKLWLGRNTTEDEKGRGLPEITKLRSTATILRATYREGGAAD